MNKIILIIGLCSLLLLSGCINGIDIEEELDNLNSSGCIHWNECTLFWCEIQTACRYYLSNENSTVYYFELNFTNSTNEIS